MHDKSAPEAGNTTFHEDATGQMELNNIDTALGQAAENFIQADAQCKAAENHRGEMMVALVEEMKKANIRTLKFKGDNLRYQPGHLTPEKIKFVPANT